MRRQSSPTHGSGQTKLVEPLGIVVGNPTGQNLPLPGIGWNLKTLQLPQYIESGPFSLNLRSLGNMLPEQEPAQELRCSDGFGLLP